LKRPRAARSRLEYATTQLPLRIITGESRPGSLLTEAAVARELGVSRVPVREALFALERDGLMEFSNAGRAFVKQLSPSHFEELYVPRLTLERVAKRLAASALRKDSSLLEKNIRATGRASTLIHVTHLDLDFHQIILEASGNTRLLKLWHSLTQRTRTLAGAAPSLKTTQNNSKHAAPAPRTAASHRELLEAFKTNSPAECKRLMRHHILTWREWLPTTPGKE
jgi:DNA-binding GntR family transcriptional regulator